MTVDPVWDTARRARLCKRGMCYVGIGCAHGRGCRGVLSPTAPKARHSAHTAADHPRERSALNNRATLCAHALACRRGQSRSRAARVLTVDGRAEEKARWSESRGADASVTFASWATVHHTPSHARRPRVDAVRGERAPARGGGAPMRAAGAEGHCADSEAQLASARVGCGGHP